MPPKPTAARRGAHSAPRRVTRRKRPVSAPDGAAGTLRFLWYASPCSGALFHFVLLAGDEPLAHRVLPATTPGGRPGLPARGVWMQVPPGSGLAEAVPVAAVQEGTCCLLGHAADAPGPEVLLAALQTGRLLPRLTTAAGIVETYSLIQLRAGGAAWLLGAASYLPAPAAKLAGAARARA